MVVVVVVVLVVVVVVVVRLVGSIVQLSRRHLHRHNLSFGVRLAPKLRKQFLSHNRTLRTTFLVVALVVVVVDVVDVVVVVVVVVVEVVVVVVVFVVGLLVFLFVVALEVNIGNFHGLSVESSVVNPVNIKCVVTCSLDVDVVVVVVDVTVVVLVVVSF